MSKTKKKHRRRNTGQQNQPIREAFGDLIDPSEWLNDEPGWGGQNVAAFLASRDKGANAPAFRTDQELDNIRGAARIICDVSVNAKCALQNLTNYVVGNGFAYSVADKNRVMKPGEQPSELAQAAGEIVDEFLERTKYGKPKRRKRLLWNQRRDGEFFATIYHSGAGFATYRVAEPGFFHTPQDARVLDEEHPLPDGGPADWTFGVHTPDDDYENEVGYLAQFSESPADFTYFPKDRVVHSKVNVDDAIKRGLSDFYWVGTELSDVKKLMRNGVRGAAVLAAIAAIIEHPPGVAQEDITSFKTAGAVSQYNQPTQNGGRTQYVHKYNAGSMLHVPAGRKYQPSPLASAGVATSITEINQAVLRIIGSNWCMPEYMISSDASNNNYASIMQAGTPFVKFVEGVQGECADEDEELLWKVLKIAYQAGRFGRGYTWQQITRMIEVKVEAQSPVVEDKEATNRNCEILNRAGLMSDRTWAAKAGLDYEQELANGAKKAAPPAAGLPTDPTTTPEGRLREAAKRLWKDYPAESSAHA